MTAHTLAALALALAATVLACGEASSSDVAVDVEPSQVDIACMKGSVCQPGRTYVPPTIVVGGDLSVYDPGPERGPDFTCAGAGPEGGGAQYRVLPGTTADLQCWSSRPIVLDNGTIPLGFTLLSLYICPAAYPVNRCDAFGRCTCWSY